MSVVVKDMFNFTDIYKEMNMYQVDTTTEVASIVSKQRLLDALAEQILIESVRRAQQRLTSAKIYDIVSNVLLPGDRES